MSLKERGLTVIRNPLVRTGIEMTVLVTGGYFMVEGMEYFFPPKTPRPSYIYPPAIVENLADLPINQETAAKLDNHSRASAAEEKIIDYLNWYRKNGPVADFTDTKEKEWLVKTTEPVTMIVRSLDGLLVKDFPEVGARSRWVPTGGKANEPQYKTWTPGEEIPGNYQEFVLVKNGNGKVQSIWVTRWSDKGGWPFNSNPHFETWAVYLDGEWLVRFENNQRKPISGEKLLGIPSSPFNLPKIDPSLLPPTKIEKAAA